MAKRRVVKRRKSSSAGKRKPIVSLNLLYAVLILAIALVVLVLIRAYLISL